MAHSAFPSFSTMLHSGQGIDFSVANVAQHNPTLTPASVLQRLSPLHALALGSGASPDGYSVVGPSVCGLADSTCAWAVAPGSWPLLPASSRGCLTAGEVVVRSLEALAPAPAGTSTACYHACMGSSVQNKDACSVFCAVQPDLKSHW